MTDWLAAVSVAVFLVTFLTDHVESAALLGGFVPVRFADPALFAHMGGPVNAVPVWLTPLSATLIHASWLHILFNMLMLMFCGRHVEHVLGPRLTLLLYGLGAYAAAGAQWAVDPHSSSPMVGASGAISALVGTYALLYSRQNVKAVGPLSANAVRIIWLAAGWIAIQLMVGLATAGTDSEFGHVAVAAHIGGFVAGLLLTKPALLLRFRKRAAGLG